MGATNADVRDAASGDATKDVDATKVDSANGDATGADTKDAKDAPKDGEDTDGLKKALGQERKARQALEKQLRDAELAKLPELDRLKTENETLAKENETLTKDNMKMKIALDLELPWRIAKRMVGDTEEELRSDAADLLKDYKAKNTDEDPKDKKRPANDAKKTGDSTGGSLNMNRALRALAGRGGK